MKIELESIDRSKAGRKPIADDVAIVSAKMPSSLRDRFAAACDLLDNSQAAVLRHLIEKFCDGVEADRKPPAKRTRKPAL